MGRVDVGFQGGWAECRTQRAQGWCDLAEVRRRFGICVVTWSGHKEGKSFGERKQQGWKMTLQEQHKRRKVGDVEEL